MTARSFSDGDNGFPDVCVTVSYLRRHSGRRVHDRSRDARGPFGQLFAELVGLGVVRPWSERLDCFGRSATPHLDGDGPGQDRVGEVAQPSKRDGAVSGEVLSFVVLSLDYTAADLCALAMPGVQSPRKSSFPWALEPKTVSISS